MCAHAGFAQADSVNSSIHSERKRSQFLAKKSSKGSSRPIPKVEVNLMTELHMFQLQHDST